MNEKNWGENTLGCTPDGIDLNSYLHSIVSQVLEIMSLYLLCAFYCVSMHVLHGCFTLHWRSSRFQRVSPIVTANSLITGESHRYAMFTQDIGLSSLMAFNCLSHLIITDGLNSYSSNMMRAR